MLIFIKLDFLVVNLSLILFPSFPQIYFDGHHEILSLSNVAVFFINILQASNFHPNNPLKMLMFGKQKGVRQSDSL